MRLRLLFGIIVALTAFVSAIATPLPENPNIDKEAEKKLQLAFGKDHKGVRETKIRFLVKAGDYVFACNTFEFEADGWVKITPGYMATFEDAEGIKRNKRLGNKFVAPSIRLRMDPPVKKISDFAQSGIKHMQMRDADVADFGKQ